MNSFLNQRKQLGFQKATEFVLMLERGKGDSVEEIAEYWGDSSIDDIHVRVTAWMKQKGEEEVSISSN